MLHKCVLDVLRKCVDVLRKCGVRRCPLKLAPVGPTSAAALGTQV